MVLRFHVDDASKVVNPHWSGTSPSKVIVAKAMSLVLSTTVTPDKGVAGRDGKCKVQE